MAKLDDNFNFEQDGKTYNLYSLPDDFTIKGDVNLSNQGLSELPNLSKVKVEGDFWCCYNQLTTLEGAPREVGGHFDCNSNTLTSLKGAPLKVGENFRCYNNRLESLYGITPQISGDIFCDQETAKKYGLQRNIFEADKLYDNQLFQRELVKKRCKELITRNKRKEREAKDAEWHKKHKAGYKAFKKKFKPGGRED